MSSCSYESICPNCQQEMNSCSENRPFEQVIHICPHCGFFTKVTTGYEDLVGLNDLRELTFEMEPLKKLPKQDKEYAEKPLLNKKQLAVLQEAVTTFLEMGDENMKKAKTLDKIMKILGG